ncbi:DNA-binding protein [Microbacterium flavum]|uniref:DNA-binding protein n=1 Tax=Microbacterium flavum TaxID=415216 RepID=A0ABS5XQV5_9MICO|nr:DNA-binding protein [Microbacterium flavum]MBT8796909.1 DNA-binding protein [Microbacterium flavum]
MSSAREDALGSSAQRDLYGATWQERFASIREAYRLPQHRLASVIGLSAPMVSQLASGQRTKITNPAVLARVTLLEEHLADPGVRSGDADAIGAVLAEASTSVPVLTTQSTAGSARLASVAWLSRHATPAQLADLADHARGLGAVEVAAVLDDARGA